MGCNGSSSAEVTPSINYSSDISGKRICSVCKAKRGILNNLDCLCWICKNCLIQNLESSLKNANSNFQTIYCVNCKKDTEIKELCLDCGCAVNPAELRSNDVNSSFAENEQCNLFPINSAK